MLGVGGFGAHPALLGGHHHHHYGDMGLPGMAHLGGMGMPGKAVPSGCQIGVAFCAHCL